MFLWLFPLANEPDSPAKRWKRLETRKK